MTTITRRQIVSAIAVLALSPSGAVAEVGGIHPDEPEWTLPRLAKTLAHMELRAIRSAHPCHWQRMNYSSVIRWNDEGLVLFYGVGPRHAVDDDLAALLAYLAKGPLGGDLVPVPVGGLYRSPCGRAWAVFVDSTAAGDCVVDPKQVDWKEETLHRLRTFDGDVGRRPRQCVL